MTSAELPYVVTERLRAARMQALSARKRSSTPLRAHQAETASSLFGGNNAEGTLSLGGPGHEDTTPVWVRRLLTALPLVALAAGLAFIGVEQDSRATLDVAEVDAALLTSELATRSLYRPRLSTVPSDRLFPIPPKLLRTFSFSRLRADLHLAIHALDSRYTNKTAFAYLRPERGERFVAVSCCWWPLEHEPSRHGSKCGSCLYGG